ncbi:DUF2274 domain-containing protein [Bradyrhizobium guangdongense]|uniref:DUF2274 domain-containing protein n=1 Tax=Bradyrhizobium guangdongense TaxID=1325090 RepID=A0A410V4F7_9BRAD|nr:DUF2274 domain-containing protein [Bradyrhizobium guangdongense]QAU38545.1 DUF2274 domain-containing protein [Bradyrhizobium guangdongense]QOZ59606.1 DUF2274 domain-containing protein [Bradyrhizobium guangdongense]GGI33411.1 hypothetical protein GCM10010987_74240 [Bradyrhizobium guangdongense]
MPKLKIATLLDDKLVKVAAELPASVHRDLIAYAEALASESGQRIDPVKLIAPMLARFMATDRGFAKARRAGHAPGVAEGRDSVLPTD